MNNSKRLEHRLWLFLFRYHMPSPSASDPSVRHFFIFKDVFGGDTLNRTNSKVAVAITDRPDWRRMQSACDDSGLAAMKEG